MIASRTGEISVWVFCWFVCFLLHDTGCFSHTPGSTLRSSQSKLTGLQATVIFFCCFVLRKIKKIKLGQYGVGGGPGKNQRWGKDMIEYIVRNFQRINKNSIKII